MNDWSVRRATPADRDRALDLLERAFGGGEPRQDAERRWDWLFRENTSGTRMHYLVADAGDRLAGQYATMPVRLRHAGRDVIGLLSLHTATDPAFARQGIFTSLAEQLYREAAEEAPVVFGFPNENSAPGFYRKLGWHELPSFPLLVRPLGGLGRIVGARTAIRAAAAVADATAPLHLLPLRLRARRSSPVAIEPLETFGGWADELWEELAPLADTAVIRDSTYLEWRLRRSPERYRLRVASRGGRVVGFSAIGRLRREGGSLPMLVELLARPADVEAARQLIADAVMACAEAGEPALAAIVARCHPHRSSLIRAGFLPAGRLSRGFSFGVRPNGPGLVATELLDISRWYLSGADLDYV